MNKFLKLPLFLGVVGGVCTAILATTYGFTNPIKLEKEAERKNAAFKEILKGFGLLNDDGTVKTGVETVEFTIGNEDSEFELAKKLVDKGYTRKVLISVDEKVFGALYEGGFNGYGGAVNYQLSFKEDKCYSFVDLGNNETAGFGKDVINNLPSLIEGKPVSEFTPSAFGADSYAGATITGAPLYSAVVAAAQDYAASL